MKVAVAYFIPDTPKWVEVELAKIAFQSRLALQKEVGSDVNHKTNLEFVSHSSKMQSVC